MIAYFDHRVMLEPELVDTARDRFPEVEFRFVPWANLDGCSGCPEGPWDPPESGAVITYRRGNWTYSQPVAGCCLEQELKSVLGSRTPVEWVRVDVLYFETRNAA